MRRKFKFPLWFQQLHLIRGLKWKKPHRMRRKQNFVGGNRDDVKQNTWPTQLEKIRSPYKGWEFDRPSQSARKVSQSEDYFVWFLLLKVQERVFPISSVCNYRVSIHFSRVYHLRSWIFNTSCQESQWTSHSRTHIPRWDDCEGALHLRGPLRLVLVYLAWPSRPLLRGARGSSPRSGQGPWHDNMCDRWSIPKPFPLFFGLECARSLQ